MTFTHKIIYSISNYIGIGYFHSIVLRASELSCVGKFFMKFLNEIFLNSLHEDRYCMFEITIINILEKPIIHTGNTKKMLILKNIFFIIVL